MTRADSVFIINEMIKQLNQRENRSKYYEEQTNEGGFKELFINDVTTFIGDTFPAMGESVKLRLAIQLYKRAENYNYPEKEIPEEGVRLNYGEILYLSEVSSHLIFSAKSTLQAMADTMRLFDDERVDKLAEAVRVLEQILSSKHERPGTNT